MISKTRKIFFQMAISVALIITGCGKVTLDNDRGPSSSLSSSVTVGPQEAPLEYRDIFFSYAKNESSYSDSQIKDLLFAPTKDMLDFYNGASHSPNNPISEIQSFLKLLKPSAFFAEGKNASWNHISSEELYGSFQKSGPITLVVFSGIFSEFNKAFPFDPMWQNSTSSFAKKFAAKYNSHSNSENKSDNIYSLFKEKDENIALPELVKAASIDGADGKPLINLLLLVPRFGSMETLGVPRDNAANFMRRVDKAFKILGEVPENLYLLGYSRGACVALDFLVGSRDQLSTYSWAEKIKGYISYAGVLFGTAAADEVIEGSANGAKSFNTQIADKLFELADTLKTIEPKDDAATVAFKMSDNALKWKIARNELTAFYLKSNMGGQSDAGLLAENIHPQFPNISALADFAKKISFDFFALDTPFSDYAANVRRYKAIINHVREGIRSLTTAQRMKWWETHALPKDIKLFTVAGTMPDITREGQQPSPLLNNKHVVLTNTWDYKILRSGYYSLSGSTGIELNDSQVSFDKTILWPKLVKFFNKDFPTENIFWTGIHATNHWGLALPYFVENSDGSDDPYPRTLILKSLGTLIARHASQN